MTIVSMASHKRRKEPPAPLPSPEAGRLCEPSHWRIDPIFGLERGYLALFYCEAGHIHYAGMAAEYCAVRAIIRSLQQSVFPDEHPGLPIHDHASLLLILPDGRQRPLRHE
jgi:hypothetical protein